MTKSETLEAIEKAKVAHISQMDKMKAAFRGATIENPTSVSKMHCAFGQWLYGENNDFIKTVLGEHFYERLDHEHEAWHAEYSKIYPLLFEKKKEKEGFFAKVFSSTNEPDTLTLDKAKTYYAELETITKQLLNALDKSIRRLGAIDASKFS